MNNYYKNIKEKIYLALLSTDSYLDYALTLYQSYLHTNSKYKFYIGVGKLVSDTTKGILKQRDIPFVEVSFNYEMDFTWNNMNKRANRENWNHVWDKIEFFNLTQFEQICCLDTDMIMLKNMDEIFDNKHNEFYASPRYPDINYCKQANEKFHCGCLLIRPSKEIYKKLCDNFIKNKKDYRNEAFLLWDTFKEFDYIDWKYNILEQWFKYSYQIDLSNIIKDTIIFHFTITKPLNTLKYVYNFRNELKPFFDKWQEFYNEWHGKQ